MKFIKSYGKFNLNESKSEIDIESEFQSVIDILDEIPYELENQSIEIHLGKEDAISNSIEDLKNIIEYKKKSVEILEDCLHVVERLKMDGANITMSFENESIKIKANSSESVVDIENIFDVDSDISDYGDRCRVTINKLNMYNYLKSQYGINLKKIADTDDYADEDGSVNTKVLVSYDGELTTDQFDELMSVIGDMTISDENGEDQPFGNIIIDFSLENGYTRNKFFSITLNADVMID